MKHPTQGGAFQRPRYQSEAPRACVQSGQLRLCFGRRCPPSKRHRHGDDLNDEDDDAANFERGQRRNSRSQELYY